MSPLPYHIEQWLQQAEAVMALRERLADLGCHHGATLAQLEELAGAFADKAAAHMSVEVDRIKFKEPGE